MSPDNDYGKVSIDEVNALTGYDSFSIIASPSKAEDTRPTMVNPVDIIGPVLK